MEWSEKFKQKLYQKELALQENKKNFQVYQNLALELFNFIEQKIKPIEVISTVKYMVGQSENTPVQIKALKLKCNKKYLDFVPEGINLDHSKGTIRIRHNSRAIAQFSYLHLVVDSSSDAVYPANLIWVLNENSSENFEKLPVFDASQLERLIELTFLD